MDAVARPRMPMLVTITLLLAGTTGAMAPASAGSDVWAAAPADLTRLGAGWLSTPANDYNLSLDAAERMLVLGRSGSGDFHDARVLVSYRRDGEWSELHEAPFLLPGERASDPWLTPDGRWLYFVSNRAAPGRDPGRDDLDLWRVAVEADRFGTPHHLAAASSEGEELGPEVHDGWLYFNSTRSGGPAALALYRVRLDGADAALPEPLPAPFNDGRAQGDVTFSVDGSIALFWSLRGELREMDLFATRRIGERWQRPVRLPAPFNGPGMDFTPSFSADGRTLRWASQRVADGETPTPGSADLYAAPVAKIIDALEADTAIVSD